MCAHIMFAWVNEADSGVVTGKALLEHGSGYGTGDLISGVSNCRVGRPGGRPSFLNGEGKHVIITGS